MIVVALALALAVAASPATPSAGPERDGPQIRVGDGDDPEAQRVRAVAQAAAALLERGEHDEALARIDEAEREGPSPAFVFMRGAIEEDRGRCEPAVTAYRSFLAMDVPTEDADAARAGLRRCGAEETIVEPPDPPPAKTDDEVTVPPPPHAPVRDAPPIKRWYADPAGGVLVAVGIASIAIGGALVGVASQQADRARDEDRLSQFDARARRAERMQPAGIAMLAIGGAFVIAAAVRYGVVARKNRRATSRTGTGPGLVYIRF